MKKILLLACLLLLVGCAGNTILETPKCVSSEKEQTESLLLADALVEESGNLDGLNILDITEEQVLEILKNPASKVIELDATLISAKLKKLRALMEKDPYKRNQLID